MAHSNQHLFVRMYRHNNRNTGMHFNCSNGIRIEFLKHSNKGRFLCVFTFSRFVCFSREIDILEANVTEINQMRKISPKTNRT